jgi:MFS family permease
MLTPRNVRLLAWLNFLAEFRLYGPIAILYFAQVSGSYAAGMSIFSAAMLSQSFFEVPTGVFSDLIGRKKTVVCGACASVLSLVFYAIGGAYLALLVGAIFEGLSRAFYSGNNDALLHDTLAEIGQREAYQEYLGKTAAMYEVGLALSAVLGSLIAAVSFQAVMWASVIPLGMALVVSFFLVEPQMHAHKSTEVYAHLGAAFHNIVQNDRLRKLSLASILSFAIGESAWLFRSAFIEKLWPIWAIGIAQMIADVGAAIGFYVAGRIIRRFGEFRLLLGGMSLSEAINLFALLAPTVFSPLLMAMNSIFFGVNSVAISGLMQREFTDRERATMGSLNSLAGSVVFALFSFLLGGLADRVGVIPALLFATLLSIVPMSLYWRALRRPNEGSDPTG